VSALATRPELRRLWEAAHRRLEQTGGRLDGARAVVDRPSADERQAVDRLLGVRSRGRALRVPLARLDTLLRERGATSLADVVVASCGPLHDRPAERAAASEADRRLWDDARRHPATGRHAELAGWFERLRVTGRLRRLDDPARRLQESLEVLELLPAPEPVARARLAASVLGDSHALDDTAPTGRLVLSALAHLAGAGDGPLTGGERRRLWADQGVALDETSSTVLTLGLHPVVVGPLTDAATRWATAGVPLPLPLAAVSAERWQVAPGTLVSACENVTVLEAAAARFGPASPPLVCVEGNPSLAARLLLASLAEGGAQLRYHGDFGTGGVAIANIVIGELGAAPWRFDTAAHAAALATARSAPRPRPCRPLAGRVPAARWDEALAPAIERCGVEVEEEHVLQELLADLTPLSP
jgi:uncharacterized protein (TIGR02679 family)